MEKHIEDFITAQSTHGLHDAIMDRLRPRLKKSREKMQQDHYKQWDDQHETYMHRRKADKQDAEAVSQGLPHRLPASLPHGLLHRVPVIT